MTRAPRTAPNMAGAGRLIAEPLVLRCALGAGGIVHRKREGDAGTPAGCLAVLSGFFRPDRTARPRSRLPFVALRRNHGWCDEASSSLYNTLVCLPLRHHHERLWREDRLYDTVIVLNYNMKPRKKGCGSAIFFHLADQSFSATAGCVAISPSDMRRLLPRLARKSVLIVR